MHYCRNKNRGYWVDGDEGRELLDGVEASKYWREDHNKCECAINGGDCAGISSSIKAHDRAERNWWRDAVDNAISHGWLGDPNSLYWDVRWETDNKYCREEIQKRNGN